MTEADRLIWYLIAEGIGWDRAKEILRALEQEYDLEAGK